MPCRLSYRAGGDYLGPKVAGPDPGPKGFEVAAECDFDGSGRVRVITRTTTLEASGAMRVSSSIFDSDAVPGAR